MNKLFAKKILNSRNQETIEINYNKFTTSAPWELGDYDISKNLVFIKLSIYLHCCVVGT
jgi:hypothetical protein